jgi:transposase
MMIGLRPALFGGPPRSRPTVLPMPDFAELHRERQQHPHLTQQLLWEEYRQANPDGYRYSRFCELYQRWRRKQDVVLRQEHKAGEKLFVDRAGTTISIHDPLGRSVQQAHLFVSVLGAHIPLGCLNVLSPTSRTRRWATDLVWASFG